MSRAGYGVISSLIVLFMSIQAVQPRGFNKTTVAVANKNARIIWTILHNETEYRPAV
ncbi:hypothetical protein KTP48_03250 [Proteus mirabilis]|nr:hypothetical protein [Proteus mirabilis]MBG6015715.1 hypothetical protein [Proteus mirabilis]MBU9977758.1 hypothetical protein [Proteus mirabilis]